MAPLLLRFHGHDRSNGHVVNRVVRIRSPLHSNACQRATQSPLQSTLHFWTHLPRSGLGRRQHPAAPARPESTSP